MNDEHAAPSVGARSDEKLLDLDARLFARQAVEIESALVGHKDVAEAAVVGRPDELKGQAVVAFVTLKSGRTPSDEVKQALREHVVREIGALARPEEIRFTEALPKTRSGKIMRRLLKEIAAGGQVKGDVTTLEDVAVLNRLSTSDEE